MSGLNQQDGPAHIGYLIDVNNRPLVTVLMTVYNSKRYVREAVESILSQTFTDFEFLIINDGSTDETCEIILSYRDPRIRLVENKSNLGLTRSLNYGLKLAEGQFIARQDSDDISELERLAQQISFMEEHPNVGLLGTWYREIDDQGAIIGYQCLPCGHIDILWSLLFYCPIIHSSVIFRKSVILDQIGFYDEAYSYAQDYDYWLRIARRMPVANLDEFLVRYRIHPHSMTATIGEKKREEVYVPAAAVADLLGWDKNNQEGHVEHFEKLFRFLYDPSNSLTSHDVDYLSAEILQLHQAFCLSHDLDKVECTNHLLKVRSWISKQLATRAHYYFDQKNKVEAWNLFRRSINWHWPTLFGVNSLIFLIKLLLSGFRLRQKT